jgi:UPF0042 nucleotide-binding protein
MARKPITIITGRSGSGKSTALAAFEDAGYYCVDNMPVAMLPDFLELSTKNKVGFSGFVFGMDLRDSGFIEQAESILNQLKENGFAFRIVFIEADRKVLLRRYNQTRRRHPLAMVRPINDAIKIEKKLLKPIRDRSDHIINTTDLNVHELKAVIRNIANVGKDNDPMRIQVMSFGFKFGLPLQADHIMDVRFLRNPYFDESLRPLDGESEKIQTYVLNNNQTCLFLRRYFDLLDLLIPQYEDEGKSYLTIAIGCTGGRHRSVVIARQICHHLTEMNCETELIHRDINRVTSRTENNSPGCS